MAPKPIVVPPLAKQYVERGSWSNETFFTLLERQAARFASREAFADARGRISYGELRERIERCAAFLRRAGIGRGDVVTVQLPNRIDFPVVFFALEVIGAVANKVNPDFRVRELEYIVNNDGAPPLGPAASFDDAAWQKALEQNLMYAIRMVSLDNSKTTLNRDRLIALAKDADAVLSKSS